MADDTDNPRKNEEACEKQTQHQPRLSAIYSPVCNFHFIISLIFITP